MEQKFPRITVEELTSSLHIDLFYSDGVQVLSMIKSMLPEQEPLPVFITSQRESFALNRRGLILVWCGWCSPSLSVYLPRGKDRIKLDWETAKNFFDIRKQAGYTYFDDLKNLRDVDFMKLEIDLTQLRTFLLFHKLCLPTSLFPKDPANSKRKMELEQEGFGSAFDAEITFSEMLPLLQEDVITAVENRHQNPSMHYINTAIQAADNLRNTLENNHRQELSQQEAILSRECLNALKYIDDHFRPLAEKPAPEDLNIIRLEHDYWQIIFQGKRYSIKQLIGMKYIVQLIERAYRDDPEIHAMELFHLINGQPVITKNDYTTMNSSQQGDEDLNILTSDNLLEDIPAVDQKRVKQQIKNLEDQILEAQSLGQEAKALNLKEDKEALEVYLSKSYGLGGRQRTSSDSAEKVRKNIDCSIRYALKGIERNGGEKLAHYLKSHIKRGLFCHFEKDPEINWEISM